MRTLLLIALTGILSAAEQQKPEPPKQPNVADLQAQVKVDQVKIDQQAKELDSLKKQLAEAKARRDLGWGYFNVCVENQVSEGIRKQAAPPATPTPQQ